MKKLYYSIGEVSEITSVEQHVLRYWESIFSELNPRKNKAGNRTYKEDDIAIVLRLKDLIQRKKYSTAGAKEVLKQDRMVTAPSNGITPETRRDLQEVRRFLVKLSEKL